MAVLVCLKPLGLFLHDLRELEKCLLPSPWASLAQRGVDGVSAALLPPLSVLLLSSTSHESARCTVLSRTAGQGSAILGLMAGLSAD